MENHTSRAKTKRVLALFTKGESRMDKSSFLIYLDYQEQFDLLTDEEAGRLIKAIIKYEKTGEIPKLDGMLKMAFSFIKTQLDRDREKWKEEKQKRSEAGKRGMAKRWNSNVITKDNKDNSVKNDITRHNKNNCRCR